MKTYNTILALLLVLFFSGCDSFGPKIIPSGNITSDTLSMGGFTGISAEDAFVVFVNYVDTDEKVVIQANDNLHAHIVVNRQLDVLELRMEHNISIKGNPTLRAIIYTKDMHQFYGSGASQITLNNPLNAPVVSVDLSGASNFKGILATDKLSAILSGASHMDVSGYSNSMDIKMSGASETVNYDFTTEDFTGNFSGASAAKITISNSIHLKASGASNLRYKGNPDILHQDLSGSSTLKKVN